MGFLSNVKKYKDYESAELARRVSRKQFGKDVRAAKKKPFKFKKPAGFKNLRLTAEGIARATDNPYGMKFPKAKKVLKKVKKKKLKQRRKTVVIYR